MCPLLQHLPNCLNLMSNLISLNPSHPILSHVHLVHPSQGSSLEQGGSCQQPAAMDVSWSRFDLCDVWVATARQMGWLLPRQSGMKFCKDITSMMNFSRCNSNCTLQQNKWKQIRILVNKNEKSATSTRLYPCHVVLSIACPRLLRPASTSGCARKQRCRWAAAVAEPPARLAATGLPGHGRREGPSVGIGMRHWWPGAVEATHGTGCCTTLYKGHTNHFW